MSRTSSKPISTLSESLVAGFWNRVRKADGCWAWQGSVNREGYGTFRDYKAHRIAFTLLIGPIDAGMTIDHTCRNRACVNPLHLQVVSPSENVKRGQSIKKDGVLYPGARKRTAARYHLRRERGLCVQCNTPSTKYRCDRCREIHNTLTRERRSTANTSTGDE